MFRKILRNIMTYGIDIEQGWLRRPVIAKKSACAKKSVEPRPIRPGVIVTCTVETHPASTVFHVFFESLPCFGTFRRSIRHYHDAVVLQFVVVITRQIRRHVQYEPIAIVQLFHELNSLLGKLDMSDLLAR